MISPEHSSRQKDGKSFLRLDGGGEKWIQTISNIENEISQLRQKLV